jgi:pyrrolidone-carboxylate peptidase
MAKDTVAKRQAYGLGSPLQGMDPLPIVADRAPLPSDKGYPIGQVWINQPADDAYILTSVAANLAHWDVITSSTPGSAPISKYVVAADGSAGYTTIQAAINAAKLAGIPADVYVRPGTYTENLTCYDSINVIGSNINTCIINGVHIPPVSGEFYMREFTLNSPTSIFSSAVAGTTYIFIEDCYGNVTNGYIFNLPNWTGPLGIDNSEILGTNNGIINNTGGSDIVLSAFGGGAGAGAAVMSGDIILEICELNCASTIQGNAVLDCREGVLFGGTLTTAGLAIANIDQALFDTGATAAINHGSAGVITISNSVIDSTNNPAIAGAGAGVININGIEFLNNAALAGTLTPAYTGTALEPIIESGATITAATGITATTGNITATAGNLVASAGSVSAFTTVTGGTGVTATTGNVAASAGAVSAFTTVTGGTGVTATTGDVTATAGKVVAGTVLRASGDEAGFASTVSVSNVVDEALGAGVLSILSKTANPGNSSGFLKIYNGVGVRYIPYFTVIAP